MCKVWKKDQWLAATNNEIEDYEGDYKLIATYENEIGETALLIAETDSETGEVDYAALPDIHVIYGDTTDQQTMFVNWGATEASYNEQLEAAKAQLARRGYAEKVPEVKVQGLTLDQWAMVGGFNKIFGFHIHPEVDLEHPENLSEIEMEALSNSLTPKERLLMALKIIEDLREYTLAQLTVLELEEYVGSLTPSLV